MDTHPHRALPGPPRGIPIDTVNRILLAGCGLHMANGEFNAAEARAHARVCVCMYE